jgi:hypothetical protein
MPITAERAGWSGAPQMAENLVYQKSICDEAMSYLRAGELSNQYQYWFGRLESVWRTVWAVSRKGGFDNQVKETELRRQELYQAIQAFNKFSMAKENIPILEEQRLKKLGKFQGDVIGKFDAFWQDVLFLGVDVGLFSFQKGGDLRLDKNTRIGGLPVVNGPR